MPGFLADVLSRPHNQGHRLCVKTARSWSVPPRQVMLGEPCVWGPDDTLLSMALVLLEEETCSECGTPSWLGHSTNNSIIFEHDSTTCFGCMELEKARADKTKEQGKGEKGYVRPRMWDDSPLPDRAQEYERRKDRS